MTSTKKHIPKDLTQIVLQHFNLETSLLMKVIQIKNSFKVWSPKLIKVYITAASYYDYETEDYKDILKRSDTSLILEWWLHNIFYYLTLPFCFIKFIKKINKRFKDVDLEEKI